MPSYLRLPLDFDPAGLKADVSALAADEWVPHFNTRYYEGDWSAVSLRSIGGKAGQIYPDPTANDAIADTPILERCPNTRAVLAAFECPLLTVRFLRLSAGSVIKEHRDYSLCYEDGEIRVHVPIFTNPGVEFAVSGTPVDMREGECWYIDFNQPHRVSNLGETDRIHLVIDCVVDDWVRAFFETAEV